MYTHTYTKEQWLKREKRFPNCWSRVFEIGGLIIILSSLLFDYIWNIRNQKLFLKTGHLGKHKNMKNKKHKINLTKLEENISKIMKPFR